MAESGFHLENTIPVLAVADVTASIRFYHSLGFTTDWQAGDTVAQVSRDRHPIMLQRRDAAPN